MRQSQTGIFMILAIAATVTMLFSCSASRTSTVQRYALLASAGTSRERVAGVEGLLRSGPKGREELLKLLDGNSEALELLVECWDNVELVHNKGGKEPLTALHRAALIGHTTVAGLLLDRGADIEALNGRWQTPLIFAVFNGRKDTVELLLKRGANVNASVEHSWFGLEEAASLHIAAMKGYLEIARILVSHGANVNAKDGLDNTPLFMAVETGHADIVRYLLENGADPWIANSREETPSAKAIDSNNAELLDTLLDAKPVQKETADSLLARIVKDEVLRMEKEKNFNEIRMQMIKSILEHGADVNATGEEGQTILMMAVNSENAETVKLLLDKGADPKAVDDRGVTVLHIAARIIPLDESNIPEGDVDYDQLPADLSIHEALVKSGAEINAKDEDGNTPLHIAAFEPFLEFAKLLVENGADVNATDAEGSTPLDNSILRENAEMEQYLKSQGAKTSKELTEEEK